MGKEGAKTELFLYKRSALAKQAHDAIYNSWERNIYLLKPERIFHTLVSDLGDLLTNNQCICKEWTKKAGLD